MIGRKEGVRLGRLELLEEQLTAKFGPLSEKVLAALQDLPANRLREVSLRVITAGSLADLGL